MQDKWNQVGRGKKKKKRITSDKKKKKKGTKKSEKKKKKEEEMGQDLFPWEGAMKDKMFPQPGKPFHQLGDWLAQKESLRGSEESSLVSLQEVEQRDRHRGSLLPHCSHSAWYVQGLGAEKSSFGGYPGRGLGLTALSQSEVAGV